MLEHQKTNRNFCLGTGRQIRCSLGIIFCTLISCVAHAQFTNDIIDSIQQLESRNDPKCYATASRLEDFMFGTPLSFEARASKNLLQRDLVKDLWLSASVLAAAAHRGAVSNEDILSVSKQIFSTIQNDSGHFELSFPANSSNSN